MKQALMVLLAVSVSGCATTGVFTTTGFGLVTAFTEPVLVGDASETSKTGEACSVNVLAVVAIGDGSINAAKRAGGITKIATVDREVLNVMGLYGKACTVVRGN